MSPRTLFLSRLIGLYCILGALSMMTRRQATVETVTALLQNPAMMLILGVITLAAGLAMVLAHNIWSGRALTVIVTLVGWITLVKSRVPEIMRVPRTSRTLRCVGFVTVALSRDHRHLHLLGLL